jgi:serine-type D-Ala-D-Ala carboxypeptidase (penicillin-binding protein 5/6)
VARWLLLAISLLLLTGAVNYLRPVDPVPATQIVAGVERVAGQPPALPWPAGEAAVAVSGIGIVGSHGDGSALPMASIAKVVTSLVIVGDHPLKPADAGETVTLTATDVSGYQAEAAGGQSVVPVELGETLTERQLLDGLLVPSANDYADILARWDAGTIGAFVGRMNSLAARLGMSKSHFADPSGFDPATVGTPAELILAGQALLADATLTQIVSQAQVDLPLAPASINVDYALGSRGVVGIKTGSSPAAGACFLFAGREEIPGLPITVVGVVMDQPTLDDAFTAARQLIDALVSGLKLVPAVTAAQAVAEYRSPWGSRTGLRAQADIFLPGWPGMIIHRGVRAPAATPPLTDGEAAGSVTAWIGSGKPQAAALVTDGPLFEPGSFWRLSRPLSNTG